jgi:esterase/lipase superfamily enzyme
MAVRHLRSLVAMLLVATLSGCVSQYPVELLTTERVAARDSQIAGRHRVFVASTRARSDQPLEVFSGGRSPGPTFASVSITVPATHKAGEIERRKKGAKADASKVFVAESLELYAGEQQFTDALRADIKRSGGRALIFVHGYNTAFDGAVYRMTQIVHDAGYPGTPVLFTWASAGRTVDYVYDTNSATAARDALEETIRAVAKAGAKRIDIIAHSMGNWVTMETFRQLAITGNRDVDKRLGDVVLASPDIDVDVFKSQMARYGVPDKPFYLLVSGDDRALRLSGFIAGKKPRVGDYADSADLVKLGVVVVDLSKVETGDALNHTKFADNPVLIKILGERLRRTDDLASTQEQMDRMTANITGTVASAAEIVITTPINVLRVAVGQ